MDHLSTRLDLLRLAAITFSRNRFERYVFKFIGYKVVLSSSNPSDLQVSTPKPRSKMIVIAAQSSKQDVPMPLALLPVQDESMMHKLQIAEV